MKSNAATRTDPDMSASTLSALCVRESAERPKKAEPVMPFVSRVGSALAQYYRWLQRMEKPW